MAQTTGLGLSSSSESNTPNPTSSDGLPDVSLSNSLMSAPPQKIFPLPFNTMPLTASSVRSVLNPAMRPSSTPGVSALTGGLLIVTTPTSPSRVAVTRSLIGKPPPLAQLEESRRPLSAADAHGDDAVPGLQPAHLIEDG